MSLFNPSSLFPLLSELKVKARRQLSQNFLIDGNIGRKIVRSAHVNKGDCVLEIGPGPGALTEEILKHCGELVVVEKDRRFAQALQRWPHPHLRCIEGDVLDCDLHRLWTDAQVGVKVISNTPYHLTGKLLQLLLPTYPKMATLTLMMQKEVALRCVAQTKDRLYNSLSVYVQLYAKPRLVFNIQPSSFYPAPSVTSALVTFELHPPPDQVDLINLFQLTRLAFQQRRKMVRRSWRFLGPARVERALESVGASPAARPQELSLDQFCQLATRYFPQCSA